MVLCTCFPSGMLFPQIPALLTPLTPSDLYILWSFIWNYNSIPTHTLVCLKYLFLFLFYSMYYYHLRVNCKKTNILSVCTLWICVDWVIGPPCFLCTPHICSPGLEFLSLETSFSCSRECTSCLLAAKAGREKEKGGGVSAFHLLFSAPSFTLAVSGFWNLYFLGSQGFSQYSDCFL